MSAAILAAIPGVEHSLANPLRSPDWRWQRAEWLYDTETPPSAPHDDDFIRRAVAEMDGQADDQALSDAAALRYLSDFRGIELEARILANQDPMEISLRMEISLPCIAAFEALFFDVRPRLAQTSWIWHEVLGVTGLDNLRPDDAESLWKAYAYRFGLETLDLLVENATPAQLRREGVRAYFHLPAQIPFELQFLIAVHCAPTTLQGTTQMKLLLDALRRQQQHQAPLPEFQDLLASMALLPPMNADEVPHPAPAKITAEIGTFQEADAA